MPMKYYLYDEFLFLTRANSTMTVSNWSKRAKDTKSLDSSAHTWCKREHGNKLIVHHSSIWNDWTTDVRTPILTFVKILGLKKACNDLQMLGVGLNETVNYRLAKYRIALLYVLTTDYSKTTMVSWWRWQVQPLRKSSWTMPSKGVTNITKSLKICKQQTTCCSLQIQTRGWTRSNISNSSGAPTKSCSIISTCPQTNKKNVI